MHALDIGGPLPPKSARGTPILGGGSTYCKLGAWVKPLLVFDPVCYSDIF